MADYINSSTVVNAASADTVNASLEITAGSNRILVAVQGFEHGAPTATTLTAPVLDPEDLAISFSRLYPESADQQMGTSSARKGSLWVLLEEDFPAAGTYDIALNASAAVTRLAGQVVQLHDRNQTLPEAADSGSDTLTVEIAATVGAVILAYGYNGSDSTAIAVEDADYTPTMIGGATGTNTGSFRHALSYGVIASAATYTTGWDYTPGTYSGLVAASFAVAAASSSAAAASNYFRQTHRG